MTSFARNLDGVSTPGADRSRLLATRRHREGGLSYVEVMVSTLLVALVLAPAIEGLSAGILSAQVHVTQTEENFHLASLLEETLARPFSDLDTEALAVADSSVPTVYSDAPATPRRRLVYLTRYDADDADSDGDPFTGGDDGLLWVRVELENTNRALETLTSR